MKVEKYFLVFYRRPNNREMTAIVVTGEQLATLRSDSGYIEIISVNIVRQSGGKINPMGARLLCAESNYEEARDGHQVDFEPHITLLEVAFNAGRECEKRRIKGKKPKR